MTRRLALLAAVLLVVLAVPAGSASAATPELQYVGKVARSDAFIAIVKKGNNVRAYLCDGKPRRTSLSVWFKDRLRNAAFQVTSAGVRLDATVYPRAAIGTVLLPDDRQYSFRAALVKRKGGLVDLTNRHRGTSYHAGWIVLPNGRVRGRTLISGTSLNGTTPVGVGISPSISPVAPTNTQAQFSECELLVQNLRALNDQLKALLASKPPHPGPSATDEKLATYASRLSAWQGAVNNTRQQIAAVEETIDRRCTEIDRPR